MIPARVILADDDPAFLEVLSAAAHRVGCEPVLCDGAETLLTALTEDTTPALVFLDIQMGEVDGFEAIKRMPGLSAPIRLHVMTGGHEAHAKAATMIARAKNIEVGRIFLKPFSMQDFQEAISLVGTDQRRPCPTELATRPTK